MPDPLPAEVVRLLADLPPCPLGPGRPVEDVRSRIKGFKLPPACMAGLWLRANLLQESHEISQDLPTTEGSFWHAVMHRREPDAWNSKYWWRRVGSHPVLDQLKAEFAEYATAERFVDFCGEVRGTDGAGERRAEGIQDREWELLFAWCYSAASASHSGSSKSGSWSPPSS